jgi:hypothetical protein
VSAFVAASNAPEPDKKKADFRCDGISDNIEIQAAIDLGSNTLMAKLQETSWATEITNYLAQKYTLIEDRLARTLGFVALARENGDTFSYEFASILRDTGSAFGSTMDELVRRTTTKAKKSYDFRDYRRFLVDTIPSIHTRVVVVNALFPLIIMPFSALRDPQKGRPKWWRAYTAIKHSEVRQQKEGSLSNAFGSVAALAIIGSQMGAFSRTDLFVNVGVSDPPDELAIRQGRVLFDMD